MRNYDPIIEHPLASLRDPYYTHRYDTISSYYANAGDVLTSWLLSTITGSAYLDLSCRAGLIEDHHYPILYNVTPAINHTIHVSNSIT